MLVAARQAIEDGDFSGAEIQRRAGLRAGQRLRLVAGDPQPGEVRQASGFLEQGLGLHLRIGGDETAGHDLFAEGIRRCPHQKGHGDGEVPIRHRAGIRGDELAIENARCFASADSPAFATTSSALGCASAGCVRQSRPAAPITASRARAVRDRLVPRSPVMRDFKT